MTRLHGSPYKDHPAYAEGWNAFEDGSRRGANPYSQKGPESSRNAWYAGWDAAWERSTSREKSQKADS